MARLVGSTTGFEMGAIPFTLVATPDLVSSNARSGVYALRIDDAAEGVITTYPSTKTEVYIRRCYRPVAATAGTKNIITFCSPEGSSGQAIVGLVSGTLQLAIYRHDANTYTQLAVGPTLTEDVWHCIEVHYLIDNTNGIFDVKLDGALAIEYAGDTYGASNYGSAAIGSVHTAKPNSGVSLPTNLAARGLYDDFADNDLTGDRNNYWVGRGGLWPVLVTGAGDLDEFTPSDAEADNFEMVDEVPANDDTDYVSSDTADQQDSYATTIPEISGGVTAFTLWHRAKLEEAGAGNLTPQLRKSGADYDGDVKGLDTIYRYVSHTWETNPATAAPWTLEDLATFYVGQETS